MIDQTKPMTESEAVAEFRAELAALLRKWGADILVQERPDDRWGEFRGLGWSSNPWVVVVEFEGPK